MRSLSALPLLMLIAACGTLPQDGPSARSINRAANAEVSGSIGYAIVELNYAVTEATRRQHSVLSLNTFLMQDSTAPADTIAVGDLLAISVFEPGGSLFGSPAAGETGAPATANQSLPPLAVDRSGTITVPFAGEVSVTGLTPQQAATAIRRSLRGKAVNPQVVVTIQESISSGVTVLGSATRPGRLPLRTGASTILDVIAAAGGPTRPAEDIMVAVTRNGQTAEVSLQTLLIVPIQNVRLASGDQVNLISRPRRYTTFGAVSEVAQVDMPAGEVTLTSALGTAGGLDNVTADARQVLIFRFERPEIARALGVNLPATQKGVPVIYRLNLAEPSGFFVANAFVVEPEDVIYTPRAGSAELRKFFEFVQAITRVIYDVTVTGTLNVN